MIPNRIYAKDGSGEVGFIRIDKVMGILKSRRDNITLGRPMWALSEDQQTEVYCINAILEEIESL